MEEITHFKCYSLAHHEAGAKCNETICGLDKDKDSTIEFAYMNFGANCKVCQDIMEIWENGALSW